MTGWESIEMSWMFRGASRRPLQFLLFLLFIQLSWADSPATQHYQAGLAYERLGRLEEAYTELQLGFALDQNDTLLATALGIVASRLGRLEVAQRSLERSLSLDSTSVASYYQLALLYEKKKLKERALDAWRRFLTLSQDEPLKTIAQKHIRFLEAPAP